MKFGVQEVCSALPLRTAHSGIHILSGVKSLASNLSFFGVSMASWKLLAPFSIVLGEYLSVKYHWSNATVSFAGLIFGSFVSSKVVLITKLLLEPWSAPIGAELVIFYICLSSTGCAMRSYSGATSKYSEKYRQNLAEKLLMNVKARSNYTKSDVEEYIRLYKIANGSTNKYSEDIKKLENKLLKLQEEGKNKQLENQNKVSDEICLTRERVLKSTSTIRLNLNNGIYEY